MYQESLLKKETLDDRMIVDAYHYEIAYHREQSLKKYQQRA